ncbi:MAG TPA: hypothetical protein VJ043_01795, partial [Candidatus Paceibacterota bacterium]|nr:hypothetical protein [Candidatus Paceibacterota bacterium]
GGVMFTKNHSERNPALLLVACALCGQPIHLHNSYYKEENGKHYHNERYRQCWQRRSDGKR